MAFACKVLSENTYLNVNSTLQQCFNQRSDYNLKPHSKMVRG